MPPISIPGNQSDNVSEPEGHCRELNAASAYDEKSKRAGRAVIRNR